MHVCCSSCMCVCVCIFSNYLRSMIACVCACAYSSVCVCVIMICFCTEQAREYICGGGMCLGNKFTSAKHKEPCLYENIFLKQEYSPHVSLLDSCLDICMRMLVCKCTSMCGFCLLLCEFLFSHVLYTPILYRTP